jgi:hypothetical protein
MVEPPHYRVEVSSDHLRFAAARFIAHPGFREPLHGHDYAEFSSSA